MFDRVPAPPPLVVAVKAGKYGPALRRINSAAVEHARARGASITVVYPDACEVLRGLAPPLMREGSHGGARCHKWCAINPDAITFARAAGLQFGHVYPDPPAWSSHVHGAQEAAQEYARLAGKPFDGPGGVYVNWYHPSQFGADWSTNAAMVCARPIGLDEIGVEPPHDRRWLAPAIGIGLGALAAGFVGAIIGGALALGLLRRRSMLPAAHGVSSTQVATLVLAQGAP